MCEPCQALLAPSLFAQPALHMPGSNRCLLGMAQCQTTAFCADVCSHAADILWAGPMTAGDQCDATWFMLSEPTHMGRA